MRTIGLLFSILALTSCKTFKQDVPRTDLYNTDDIAFDGSRDDPSFSLCHPKEKTYQYFNRQDAIQFEGGKPALEKIFRSNYKVKSSDNGWLRIRFLVNCKGESDRFRIMSADKNWKQKDFSKTCVNQLLNITKELDGWLPKQNDDGDIDYYQYLIFKIDKGKITKILP